MRSFVVVVREESNKMILCQCDYYTLVGFAGEQIVRPGKSAGMLGRCEQRCWPSRIH